MNNVAIVGTCVNLSPEKKGEKTHEKSSTASMVNLKQRIFTASVMNLNVHGWSKFLTCYDTPAWIHMDTKKGRTSRGYISWEWLCKFLQRLWCVVFQKKCSMAITFFPIFTHVASLELGDPLTQLHTNAREILPRCSKENSTVEVWQKRGSAMFWVKKQCKFHIAQSCRSQTAWESQMQNSWLVAMDFQTNHQKLKSQASSSHWKA